MAEYAVEIKKQPTTSSWIEYLDKASERILHLQKPANPPIHYNWEMTYKEISQFHGYKVRNTN
jgi:hypothetical protein